MSARPPRVRNDATTDRTRPSCGGERAAPLAAPPVRRVGAAGNLATARSLGPLPRAIDFPHAERIRAATGTRTSFAAVLDPQGCAARGTPAYSDGLVTHFASPEPRLHVAAHEATHQLQHSGASRDAGLGAEAHAGLVADTIEAGGCARSYVGARGHVVAPAVRYYTDAKDWDYGKLADTGESITFHNQRAYATPALIGSSAAELARRKSGVKLAAGAATRSIAAPDGSGIKTLSELTVTFDVDPTGQNFYGDCRQAAHEVMGNKGAGDSAITTLGGSTTHVPPPPRLAEIALLTLYLEERIGKEPNYPSFTDAQKHAFVEQVAKDYALLDKDEIERLRKRTVGEGTAERLGIDRHVAPAVGEAFAVFPSKGGGQYEFHFATVIMAPGDDRVTLENAGGDKNQQTPNWRFDTYGAPGKAPTPTFHDEWSRTFGPGHHTMRIANQPTPPADAGALGLMPTGALLERHAKSTDGDERFHIARALEPRLLSLKVHIHKRSDWIGRDWVFARLTGGAGTRDTETAKMKEGEARVLTLPVSQLLPVTGPLATKVYEWNLLGDDLIGSVAWQPPYRDVSVHMTGNGADYEVTLQL